MKSKVSLLIADIIGIIVLTLLDQFTKNLAVFFLKNQNSFVIWDGVLELSYLENKGAAFGMLQNQKIFFIFIALVILGIIFYVLIKAPFEKKYTLLHVLLVIIAAGSIGNMIDRLMQNYVVDFIYFSLIDFPVFNVADIYVTCSLTALIVAILFYYSEDDFSFMSVEQKLTRKVSYDNKDQK